MEKSGVATVTPAVHHSTQQVAKRNAAAVESAAPKSRKSVGPRGSSASSGSEEEDDDDDEEEKEEEDKVEAYSEASDDEDSSIEGGSNDDDGEKVAEGGVGGDKEEEMLTPPPTTKKKRHKKKKTQSQPTTAEFQDAYLQNLQNQGYLEKNNTILARLGYICRYDLFSKVKFIHPTMMKTDGTLARRVRKQLKVKDGDQTFEDGWLNWMHKHARRFINEKRSAVAQAIMKHIMKGKSGYVIQKNVLHNVANSCSIQIHCFFRNLDRRGVSSLPSNCRSGCWYSTPSCCCRSGRSCWCTRSSSGGRGTGTPTLFSSTYN